MVSSGIPATIMRAHIDEKDPHRSKRPFLSAMETPPFVIVSRSHVFYVVHRATLPQDTTELGQVASREITQAACLGRFIMTGENVGE